jgi:signal transduction histidine kinase
VKSVGRAIEALSTAIDPPVAAALAHSRRKRVAESHFATEDPAALRVEIGRQSQELDRCRTTIDALVRLLARAKAASAAKADLLAEMSHELRTPLNAVIGFGEIMQSERFGAIGNPTYRNYIDDIIFCGRHLLGIVDDTLDLARHEAGKVSLREEHVAIETVVAEAFCLIGPQAERGRIVLSWRPATTNLPRLYCDRLRLRQILLNALSNAVKFTEPGGQVEVTTDLSDGLALVVTDTGIGIEPENIPLALTRFEQISSNGLGCRGGAGLGLTLAKALTEQHGGSLSLQSMPHAGTSVRIWFPAQRVAATDPGDRTQSLSSAI